MIEDSCSAIAPPMSDVLFLNRILPSKYKLELKAAIAVLSLIFSKVQLTNHISGIFLIPKMPKPENTTSSMMTL